MLLCKPQSFYQWLYHCTPGIFHKAMQHGAPISFLTISSSGHQSVRRIMVENHFLDGCFTWHYWWSSFWNLYAVYRARSSWAPSISYIAFCSVQHHHQCQSHPIFPIMGAFMLGTTWTMQMIYLKQKRINLVALKEPCHQNFKIIRSRWRGGSQSRLLKSSISLCCITRWFFVTFQKKIELKIYG